MEESCNCFARPWEITWRLGDTIYLGIGLDKIYHLSGSKSRWKSSTCNFTLHAANPSVTEIALYTSLTDARKGQSYNLHTIIKASRLKTTMSSGPPVGIQGGSFWKATQNQKISFNLIDLRFRAICLTVCLCQRRECLWLSCSCERERENAVEAGKNMDFVKAINTSSKSITPCACSRTRFQPVNQVADGPCNNTQAPVLRWEIYSSLLCKHFNSRIPALQCGHHLNVHDTMFQC